MNNDIKTRTRTQNMFAIRVLIFARNLLLNPLQAQCE